MPLLWFAGGMWGNGKCQRRGRESLAVAVRWGFCNWSFVHQPSSCLKVLLFLFSCPTLSKEMNSSPRRNFVSWSSSVFLFSYSLRSFYFLLSPWRILIVGLSNVTFNCRGEFVRDRALLLTFVHKQWREFEARHCPTTPNVV